jgi:mono/diheme cytochrome c family protein
MRRRTSRSIWGDPMSIDASRKLRLALALATALGAAVIGSGLGLARADETDIVLKEASGRDTVLNNCGACHSLDYIQMNSPFLDKTGWDGEVTKMIKMYGAPIDDEDAKAIASYLAANYGK